MYVLYVIRPPFVASLTWELWHLPRPSSGTRRLLLHGTRDNGPLWIRILFNKEPLNLESVLGRSAQGRAAVSRMWGYTLEGWWVWHTRYIHAMHYQAPCSNSMICSIINNIIDVLLVSRLCMSCQHV